MEALDDRHCDLRTCWCIAEVSVVLDNCKPTDPLLLCAIHFKALMGTVEGAKLQAEALDRV